MKKVRLVTQPPGSGSTGVSAEHVQNEGEEIQQSGPKHKNEGDELQGAGPSEPKRVKSEDEEEKERVQSDEEEGVQSSNEGEDSSGEYETPDYEEYEDTGEEYEDTEKGKRKRKSDPFRVPANQHTVETFLATNPFLSVEERYIPTYCRFDPTLKMNPETLMTIMGACLEQYSKVSRAFPGATTELEHRIKHAILVTGIRNFMTTPSDERPAKRRRLEAEDMKVTCQDEEEPPGTGRSNHTEGINSRTEFTMPSDERPAKRRRLEAEDMKVSCQDEEEPPGTGSSNKSMHTEHEKAEGRTVFRISMQDLRAMKWDQNVLLTVTLWRLGIIVEAKGEPDLDGIYQGIASSQHQLLKNFQSGHVDPVYPLVITPTEWTYSMLEVEGLLEVKNKKITRASYQAYEKMARRYYRRVLKRHVSAHVRSYADLQKQLLKRIQISRAYRDGWYMVGRLYEGDKVWYPLPRSDYVSGGVSHGAKMFYEGLARCVIGERVLSWTKEDAIAAAMARDRVEAEVVRYSGVQPPSRLTPAYRFIEGLPQECREEVFAVMRKHGQYHKYVGSPK